MKRRSNHSDLTLEELSQGGGARRDFLIRSAMAAAGVTMGQWSVPAGAADLGGYRALVCVFLLGGNDSFNMVVPRSQAEYDVYAQSRQNLAVAQNDLLPITPLTPDGAQYGLHPSMPDVKTLFDAQNAAIVANMGPLVEPATKDEILNASVSVPPQLFSHNDQQDQWHSLAGLTQLKTGWAGRTADLLGTLLPNQALPVNVSLSGNTLFQVGDGRTPYSIGADGAEDYDALIPGGYPFAAERRAMFERLLAVNYSSIYTRALADVHRDALDLAGLVQGTLANHPPPANTVFPASQLGQQLQLVSQLISARNDLSMSRQIFLVSMGGFDTHDNQVALQPGLLEDVSQSLSAFHSATVELGVGNDVTAFTASDFGRTLTSNGDGTDHGWGGHQLVVGGAVQGGDIYGQMPLLQLGGADDLDAGRMVPTIAVDQYAATLLNWFGLSAGEIDQIAPNLANFPIRELGFI
ncbi:MAG: DUF1501 domain-containing protein [Gammaproteobacteria bacterium]